MKSPDKFVRVANRNLDECKAECTGNCSCVAYAYANLSITRTTGDMTRCLVWSGELIDTEKVGDVVGSDTLYLRLAGSNAAVQGVKGKSSNALRIALPTVLTSTILIITGILLACWIKSKGKRGNKEDNNKISPGARSKSDKFVEGSAAQDVELPFIKFEDIEAATHNFSEAYKIGQGGFGKVYKAMLGGQEVAIKRLSKDSEQGTGLLPHCWMLLLLLPRRLTLRLGDGLLPCIAAVASLLARGGRHRTPWIEAVARCGDVAIVFYATSLLVAGISSTLVMADFDVSE